MSILKLITFLIITTCFFQLSLPVYSQVNNAKSENSVKIAVLNLEVIRRKANVIKGIHKQISDLEKGIKEGIKKEEEALRTANQD